MTTISKVLKICLAFSLIPFININAKRIKPMNKIGYGHMVLDDYVHRLRAMREQRRQKLDAIKTPEDAIKYRNYVRDVVAKAFAPFPEKCPLDIEYGEILNCDGYRIEKVRFSSRKDFWVTANLYIPDNLQGKAPAVLGSCGHSLAGKACDTYQEFCLRLVKNGFVVLIYDPIHQGERDQYAKLEYRGVGKDLCGGHNVMCKQLSLIGESFASWRVWDGRCALDVLLTRPEVDPTKIGITGNSGGGTLTEWIWANEPRLAFAAPSCHVTSFLTNLENELPTDAEQCPRGVIGAGLEMVDLMIAQAPKPVMLLGQKYDFFERRGLLEAYADLKQFYKAMGCEENVEMFLGPTTHGYSSHNQEAMVDFMYRRANLPGKAQPTTPQAHTEAELAVLPTENVVKSGSKPIYELVRETAAGWAKCREVPKDQQQWKTLLNELLHLPERNPQDPPHFRIPRPASAGGKLWARYAVETERDIRAILRKRLVNRNLHNTLDVEAEVHLYLPNISAELDAEEAYAQNLNPDGPIYMLDPRGLGESMPEEAGGDFFQAYGMDYMMNYFGVMFGESYLGRRVFDVLRTMDLLVAEGAEKIHLHGRGMGAILATFAGFIHDNTASIELADAPASFQQWIDDPVPAWPSSTIPFKVLRHFDLPDIYQALQPKLKIVSYWNAQMKP